MTGVQTCALPIFEPDFIEFKDSDENTESNQENEESDSKHNMHLQRPDRRESKKFSSNLLPEQLNKYDKEQKRIKQAIGFATGETITNRW